MKQEIFVKELEKLKIDNSKLEKLEIYYDFLKRYNEHTNLTTIIDKEEVYLKHFYDSLTISKVII